MVLFGMYTDATTTTTAAAATTTTTPITDANNKTYINELIHEILLLFYTNVFPFVLVLYDFRICMYPYVDSVHIINF